MTGDVTRDVGKKEEMVVSVGRENKNSKRQGGRSVNKVDSRDG